MTTYRWTLRSTEGKEEVVRRLQHELNDMPRPLAHVLCTRGVETFDQARRFFRPSLDSLHDPFLMTDMEPAAERLTRAIRAGERVLIYGDYDVDGVTSTALMTSFLRDQGLDPVFFVPHRFRDGYGLGKTGIDYAKNCGATLIVALDCGITAHEPAHYAKSLGLDLIICDHHTAGDTLPEAVAVLDPKRPDCHYPFDELSGCGVGFKLVQATLRRLRKPSEDAHRYLDLVALSIASDIVPIVGENRTLMSAGLRQIRTAPRPGIRALAITSKLDLAACSTSQIVFKLGPRINAAGRLEDAKLAVELMTAHSMDAACASAQRIESINERRRTLDRSTFQEAVHLAESSCETCMEHALVLHKPTWHLGVIGIVASRLVERFNRPVIMLSTHEGQAKGSARSVNGFNVYNAIDACADLLTQFGGHDFAAGLALPEERVDTFRKHFNVAVRERFQPEQMERELKIDAELKLNDLTPKFRRLLPQFGPFGPHNPKPTFVAHNLRVVDYPSFTRTGGHLKFRVSDASDPSRKIAVIGFSMGDYLPVVRKSMERPDGGLSMAFNVEENTWNGRTTLQLNAKDLRAEA